MDWRKMAAAMVMMLGLSTGCVSGRVGLVVNPDGSGTMDSSVRLAQAAGGEEAYRQWLGNLPVRSGDCGDGLAVSVGQGGDAEVYWTRLEFASPEDLNQAATQVKLFKSFNLQRQEGLFKDRFVLEAEVASLADLGAGSDLPLMQKVGWRLLSSDTVNLELVVTAPGAIVETNGQALDVDSGTVSWRLPAQETGHVYLVTERWTLDRFADNTDLGLLAIIGLGAAAVLGSIIYLLFFR